MFVRDNEAELSNDFDIQGRVYDQSMPDESMHNRRPTNRPVQDNFKEWYNSMIE